MWRGRRSILRIPETAQTRAQVESGTRHGRQRVRGTHVGHHSVSVGDLADLIWDPRPLREAAKEWRSGRDEEEPLMVAETMDGLLTQLEK